MLLVNMYTYPKMNRRRTVTAIHDTRVIKKTVAIQPVIDGYIRKIWAMLVDEGYDANYSTALNFMLLLAIVQVTGDKGLSEETKRVIWAYAENRALINALNLEEDVSKLKSLWGNND